MSKLEKGRDLLTPFDRKLLRAAIFLLRLCTSLIGFSCSTSVIDFTLEGLARIPCLVMRCPKDGRSSTLKEHFFGLSFMLIDQNFSKVSFTSANISSLGVLLITMSSTYALSLCSVLKGFPLTIMVLGIPVISAWVHAKTSALAPRSSFERSTTNACNEKICTVAFMFLRYIDTKTNGDTLRKCILEGPYKPTTIVVSAVATTDDSLEVPQHTTVETILNMSPNNKAYFQAKKEAIFLLVTGKDIAKPVTPLSELGSDKDNDPEQAQKDKEIQKNLALIAKYFKKLYKPTNNNLRTSSNSRNNIVDNSSRYKNDNQSGQFGNQRTMTVARAKETECWKPKLVKDYTYHKEKMLLCKQVEKGVPLQAEQADWLEDTDEEIDEQELEAHNSYMEKIQEVDQNVVECDDERVALANVIANLKLDINENKKPNAQRIPKPSVLGKPTPFSGVTYRTSVSRSQLKSTQVKDKVVQNISQMKFKKNKVEDHHRISSISNKTKSVTAYNDSLKSKTLNVNTVWADCGKCTVRFGSDQFVLILGYGYLIKGNVKIKRVYYVEGLNQNLFLVGQFCYADLKVAFRKSTCYVRGLHGNDLLTGNRGSGIYTISLQESTSSTPICFMAKASPTQAWLWHQRLFHLNFDYINLLLKKDVMIGLPKLKFVKDQLCSYCEENNNDIQAEIQEGDAQIDENEFYNIFSTPIRKENESSTRYVDNLNMHTFNQPHQSVHQWTKDNPLEQVRRNTSKLVQTRRQLTTNPEMCMFALTVSTIEPKNIKETMADCAWIEGMCDEVYQFDKLQVWEIIDKPFVVGSCKKEIGGNEATRKTQMNLLKQQYENFTTPSSEMLDQTFDRLQNLMTDLDTMSMDDLYNNLEVYEPKVKGMSSSRLSTHNIAFVSSLNNNTSNTNRGVNTAHRVSTTSTQVNVANYALMAFSSLSSNSEIGLESLEEKCKVYKKNKSIYSEDIKGLKVEIHIDEFVNKLVVENCKAKSSEEEPKVVRKNESALIIKDWVSNDEEEDVSHSKIKKKTVKPHHKVKVIRYDNEIKFKNREMNQFFKMKAILRHFSVARTLQQNKVDERRNRTLIKAAKIKLADFKLPTTFWAEAADECFFIGYSLNSKAFRIFNSRTRIVKENLHIRFSESTPNVVGTKASDNASQARKEAEPVKDYILLPLWTANPPFSHDPKSSPDDGFKPSSDDGKKVNEDSRKEGESKDQKKEANVNNTNNVNTVNAAGTNKVNSFSKNISIELPDDTNMTALEDASIFDYSDDDEDVGVEADMNNLDTIIPVRRTQKGNLYIEGSKLHIGYTGRASTIQVTRSLDISRFTKRKKAIGKAKKNVRLIMEKLIGMELELMLAKTINGEVQLHAIVDGKKIIIIESSVRRDLQLADEEDEAVYKELGNRLVRAATTASSLEAEHDNGAKKP
uniref:Integrase, catalytic region, zinc finger, CCHC-type, peptidase aspartic, catalytic n=1 Tax=Tanacetum cinerariifolium TaxID=118510 RepID=A0A699GNU2_TANCI|nr:integrase, catalytic region, zinc finger, CCHC-type, peptidase aspartic, catalytic [Tanacetum cinerariifolium]